MDWNPQRPITKHDYIDYDEHMAQIDGLKTIIWIAVLAILLIAVEVCMWNAFGGVA